MSRETQQRMVYRMPESIELTWTSLAVPAPDSLAGRIVIVIDVLRATSTIVTALANGARSIVPVPSVEAAFAAGSDLERSMLGGERSGLRIERFDLGNSPLEYTPGVVAGKTIVLTTTNGTLALDASRRADEVVCGSMLNADAVARHVVAAGVSRLLIVCAGTDGEFSLDDAVTAGAILDRILSRLSTAPSLSDSATASLILYRSAASSLFTAFAESTHGRRLIELGLAEDVRYCATIDSHDIVPVLAGSSITLATNPLPDSTRIN